ncbi:MAG: hypothetical protein MI724_12700, partial [Spirochaetales bacterium]|nr:hypothetical protein [Spirochaetales bacterium]
AEEAFVRDFEAAPEGAFYELYRPEQLVERGLFSSPGISRAARPRWGTFVGLAKERVYIEDRTQGQEARNFLAVHGGDDPDERRVPLFRRDYEF